MEGRITEPQLDHFRMEVDGRGISSYPHPWLMPEYWQTPTVSMGLGPIAAIYQARNFKYLEGRGLMPKTDRKVWCFLGDGETDEPESLGAISVARSEEHTSELQSLMRISYAVFCLKKKRQPQRNTQMKT